MVSRKKLSFCQVTQAGVKAAYKDQELKTDGHYNITDLKSELIFRQLQANICHNLTIKFKHLKCLSIYSKVSLQIGMLQHTHNILFGEGYLLVPITYCTRRAEYGHFLGVFTTSCFVTR